MIDIVFLLLVFFVMTFRITPQEGDLAIEAGAPAGSVHETATTALPLRLRMDATPDGEVARMNLNGESVDSLERLKSRLIELAGDGALRDVTMTIDCDPKLKYAKLIAALDHVTAHCDEIGQRKTQVAATRFVCSP